MDIEKIKELMELVEKSSFTEFSLTEGEEQITLKKGNGFMDLENEVLAKEIPSLDEQEEEEYIVSPMVGIFYNSPSPEASPYVNVGDVIKVGQPLCIIEAMKSMNEIDSEYDAEIISIIVSNEQKVEYGQPLFKVKRI